MRSLRVSLLLFSLSFILCLALYAEDKTIEPFVIPNARASALGGVHAGLGDDFYTLFTNPASFVGVKEQFNAAEITVSMYGPVFEILDLAQKMGSGGALDISGITGQGGFAAGFDMAGPVSLGWVGRGLGMGVFNRTKAHAVMTGTMLRPVVFEDILLVGGYSFRLLDTKKHIFDAGFLGKGYYRGSLDMQASVFDITTLLDDPMGNEFKTYLGLGLDLGLRYEFDDLTLALVCYDVYSPAMVSTYASMNDFMDKKNSTSSAYSTVTRRLNLGFKYKVHSNFLDRYISDFILLADYNNFLDLLSLIPRNPVLNIGIGAEVRVLEVLSLRLGIADALPAAGFGLDYSFFRFDCSMHGKELGLDPGVQPVYALDLSFIFRY
jgi:hypothetical protein